MKDKNFLTEFLNLKISNKSIKSLVLVLGLIGIFLIFISSFFGQYTSDSNKKHKDAKLPEYSAQMQKNLENIISNIGGAGKTKVLVTLENGSETIYAKEEKKNKESLEDKAKDESSKTKQSDDSEVKYITVKESDGTEKALALKELEPTVKGIIVVCEGGNNKDVRTKVVEAVKTALNISEKRVYVTR